MPLFFHDTCLFGDPVGFSIYCQEHAYEHVQFLKLYQAKSPPVLLPDYDLGSWENEKSFVTEWLATHEAVHEQLRALTGVSGVNLADVDLTKEAEWYVWMDDHRAEHGALRAALGITS